MAFKFILLAALVSCSGAAYNQESAASASQVAYAESQNYDQTGPGAKSAAPQSSANVQTQSFAQYQPQPQVYSSLAQDYAHPQVQPQQISQGFALPQEFAQLQGFAQPQAYSHPQSFSFQNQPQLSFSHLQSSPSALSHASPAQFAYSQPTQAYAQASLPAPSFAQQPQFSFAQPQLALSPSPQATFAYQPQALKSVQLKVQPEYESAPQYSFNAQDALNADANKLQFSQNYQSFGAPAQQQAPKAVPVQQPQAYVAPAVRAQQSAKAAYSEQVGRQLVPSQQFYSSPAKGSFQAPAYKAVYSSPVSKYSAPQAQQFSYSH